jgi:transcriptional regulator with XRE-family HTH domain
MPADDTMAGRMDDPRTAKACRRFAAAVQRARQRAKLTQEQLAERSDVSWRYLQRVESGEMEPGLGRVERIAEGLGLKCSTLLRRAGL